MKLECHLAQIVKWSLRPRNDCTRLLRPRRVLSEGRDFDDFGGIFPPERLRGKFGQRPGPMRRDNFPSPIAAGDDRKGESPPHEICPIPFDIQIGLIPAVAAVLRPASSPGASHQLRPNLPEGDRGRLPPEGFWPWPALMFRSIFDRSACVLI